MSSAAQALANRQNSLLSTGPVTAAGKAASSHNALRHGLTSKHVVLPGEDAAEYDALRDNLINDYDPANETERTLVEEVAAGSWRLARARRQETAILKRLVDENTKDAEKEFSYLFLEKPKEIERLLRYITTIERSYYRALSKLEKLQKERAALERRNAVVSTWAKSAPQKKNGLVSQSAPCFVPKAEVSRVVTAQGAPARL
jgi:hypothetical protein